MSEESERIAALEQEVARLRKVNGVLIRRVQRSLDSAGSDYGLFEQNIRLERLVGDRTAELLERNAQLQRTQARAEAAAEAKGRFLANMSHELRTPLNVVIGATQILAGSEELSAESRQLLQTMLASSEHLLGLIDDILDFSRAEDGSLRLHPVPTALLGLLEETVTAIRLTPVAAGLRLELDIAPEVPAHIEADPRRLRQVLVNLLTNACKFTDQGRVSLEVRVVDGALHLAVRDTGIGIAPDRLQQLFGRFSQVDETDSRRAGGVGLGLSICQHLVSLWGGTLAVESSLGVGTCFAFTYPLREVASRQHLAHERLRRGATLAGVPAQRKRVLLVDDHPVNRLVARRLLEQLGAQVEEAASGCEALAALERSARPHDMILMDCQMPEMDGFETTRRIRSLASPLADIPIIALTASALDEDRERCFQAGMNSYLAKPVRRDLLQEALAALERPRRAVSP